MRPDPLPRLIKIPYATSLPIMARTIRLETNDRDTFEHTTELFAPYPGSRDSTPEFVWSQSRLQTKLPWVKRLAEKHIFQGIAWPRCAGWGRIGSIGGVSVEKQAADGDHRARLSGS